MIVVGLLISVGSGESPTAAASMPAFLKAAARANAACLFWSGASGCHAICTLVTITPTQIDLSSNWRGRVVGLIPVQVMNSHPPCWSAASKKFNSPRNSGSFEAIPQANCIDGKLAATAETAVICSADSRCGALYLANSSCASAAFCSAAAARSFACAALSSKTPLSNSTWASRSFDRFRNSVWILASNRPNRTSPTMPSATAPSMQTPPHCSMNESYGGCIHAMMSSPTIAATTSPAHPHSHRSQDSDAVSSWLSAAFIIPSGKRHAGSSFRGFWIGLAVGSLMFAILLVIELSLQ
jgi:hypothetical protein